MRLSLEQKKRQGEVDFHALKFKWFMADYGYASNNNNSNNGSSHL